MSKLIDDLDWLRTRFVDLSIKCGEDRNTRPEHDLEDEKERLRAATIIATVKIALRENLLA